MAKRNSAPVNLPSREQPLLSTADPFEPIAMNLKMHPDDHARLKDYAFFCDRTIIDIMTLAANLVPAVTERGARDLEADMLAELTDPDKTRLRQVILRSRKQQRSRKLR